MEFINFDATSTRFNKKKTPQLDNYDKRTKFSEDYFKNLAETFKNTSKNYPKFGI